MSRERPVNFNTEMVKAILYGRKTCTRRPVKKQPREEFNKFDGWATGSKGMCATFDNGDQSWMCSETIPYQKDDILYVRETWGAFEDCHIDIEKQRYFYRADMDGDSEEIRQDYIRIGYKYHFKPSIHMPKKAARIWLKVTGIRVEKIQEISEIDAVNEGMIETKRHSARFNFIKLWNSIYNNFSKNPWVWVIDFEVIKNDNN